MSYTKDSREEVIKHLKPYMDDEETTEDLRKCCERCEDYVGKEHDFEQCRCPILEMWYELEYYRWCDSSRTNDWF